VEGWSKKDVEPIDPGDAEEAVKAFRGYLREEKRLKEQGDGRGAREARRQAEEKYEAIARMLAGRFRRYAKGAFQDGLPHLVVEAQGEMNVLLCSDLMDLEPKNELYERRFNLCVRRLMQDAVKRVRVQNDMPANGEIAMWDYVPESLQGSEGRPDDEENRRVQPADDTTREILEQILGNDIVRRLLSHVPNEKPRRIFVLKGIEGLTWSEVAREVGVSESTVKRHYKWVRETLQSVALQMGLERKEKR
jgi:RNA polymerase sigma factor (sigma-70 family)